MQPLHMLKTLASRVLPSGVAGFFSGIGSRGAVVDAYVMCIAGIVEARARELFQAVCRVLSNPLERVAAFRVECR